MVLRFGSAILRNLKHLHSMRTRFIRTSRWTFGIVQRASSFLVKIENGHIYTDLFVKPETDNYMYTCASSTKHQGITCIWSWCSDSANLREGGIQSIVRPLRLSPGSMVAVVLSLRINCRKTTRWTDRSC